MHLGVLSIFWSDVIETAVAEVSTAYKVAIIVMHVRAHQPGYFHRCAFYRLLFAFLEKLC